MNRCTATILLLLCGFMLKVVAQVYVPLSGNVNAETCLVGSVSGDGELYFLSAATEGKSTSKMKAVKLSTDEKGRVVATDDCLWKVELVGTTQLRLRSLTAEAYLSRKGDDKLDLMLASNANKLCDWLYDQSADNSLHLYATSEKNRQLSVDLNTNGSSSFANYSTSYVRERSLTFYHASTLSEGCNVWPQPNEEVCLTTNDMQQACAWGGGVVSCSDAALMNGHIAPFNDLQTWTIEFVADGNNQFYLKSGDKYLSYEITPTNQKCAWTIRDGYICTTDDEPRYLDYDGGTWRVAADASELSQCIRLCKVETAPTKNVTAQQVYVLNGGWTSSTLANCSFEDVRCIDLTHISLPRHLQNFKYINNDSNIPIFIKESEREALLNNTWRFVVTCAETSNKLYDSHLMLADKKPFFTDRSFTVEAGQIVYQRIEQPTDRWQTLSIPFKAKTVSGSFYQLKNIADENITFAKTELLDADCGYIVCPNNSGIIAVAADACTINSNANVAANLKGTNEVLKVDNNEHAIYMLHSVSQSFKRAAKGSLLYPFRAYITPTTTLSKMNIKLIK